MTPSAHTVSAATPHRFEYSTVGGRELSPGLQETETNLRIDYDLNEVFVERRQPFSDKGGEPIGTFRTALPADLRAKLLGACAEVPLSSVIPGGRGGPGFSLIRLTDSDGPRVSRAEFTSGDITSIEKADPILSVANALVGRLTHYPFQAITLKVQHRAEPHGGFFEVEIANVGTETVMIPDPRMLGSLGTGYQHQGLGVRIAEYPPEKPGYTAPPLEWSTLPIASPKHDAPPISLAPGATLTAATAQWRAPRRGMRHLVQASYSFYGEPAVKDGHPMIRGRALSEALEITP